MNVRKNKLFKNEQAIMETYKSIGYFRHSITTRESGDIRRFKTLKRS